MKKIKLLLLNILVFSSILVLPIRATDESNVSIDPNIVNGEVSIDNDFVEVGDAINITITPEVGYQLKPGSLKFKVSNSETLYPINGEKFIVDEKINSYTLLKKFNKGESGNYNLKKNTPYKIVAMGGGVLKELKERYPTCDYDDDTCKSDWSDYYWASGNGVYAIVNYEEDTSLTFKVGNGSQPLFSSTWIYDGTPSTFKSEKDREATLLVGASAGRRYEKRNWKQGDAGYPNGANAFSSKTNPEITKNEEDCFGATQFADGYTIYTLSEKLTNYPNTGYTGGMVGWYNGTAGDGLAYCGDNSYCNVSIKSGASAYIKGEYNQVTQEKNAVNDTGYIVASGGVGGNAMDNYAEVYSVDTNSLMITAEFEPIKYNITYNLNAGNLESGIDNLDKYTMISEEFTLNNPIKEGYTFLGWTIENDEFSFKVDVDTINVSIPKGTIGNMIATAHWSANPYYLKDDQSNIGFTFEDAVEYHIYEPLVLNPIVEEHYFVYPESIQVKLNEISSYIIYDESLVWGAFDIYVKADSEYEALVDIKSNEIRKFLIENGYLPYHQKDGEVVEPYNNEIDLFQIYTIDERALQALSGQVLNIDSIVIYDLTSLKEFAQIYNVSFINIHLQISQEIVDEHDNFNDLVNDMLLLGITDLMFKDCSLEKYGEIILPDDITSLIFDNVITKNFTINNDNKTIKTVIILNSHIKGDLTISNNFVEKVIVKNTIIDGNVLIEGNNLSKVEIEDVEIGGSLTINPGNECDVIIKDSDIKGDVIIKGDNTKVEIDNSHIGGDLTIDITGEADVIIKDSNIDGDVTIKGDEIKNVIIDNTDIGGDLTIEGDDIENVIIKDSDIKGDVIIDSPNADNVDLEDSNIEGDLTINGELITKLNLSGSNIDDKKLAEIDFETKFPNLIELDVSNNNLTKFDVNISNLESLNASNNKINNINTDKYPNLKILDLSHNNLNEIDLTFNMNLTNINLDGNKFTSIDLSQYTNLTNASLNNQSIEYIFEYDDEKLEIDLKKVDTKLILDKIIDVSSTSNLKTLFKNTSTNKSGFIYQNGFIKFNDKTSIEDIVYSYESGLAFANLNVNIAIKIANRIENDNDEEPQDTIIISPDNKGIDGIRLTIVDTENEIKPIWLADFSSKSHYGYKAFMKSKLDYLTSDKLTFKDAKYNGYSNYVISNLPSVIKGDNQSIKDFFSAESSLKVIVAEANLDYEDLVSGKYKIILEPILYFYYNYEYYSASATELAIIDKTSDLNGDGYGELYEKSRDIIHDKLPNSMYLDTNKHLYSLGFSKGVKKVFQTNNNIINTMGINIISFDKESIVESIKLDNYKYRSNTDVYTSVNLTSNIDRAKDNPIDFKIVSEYFSCADIIEVPAGQSQLAWCKWKTPKEVVNFDAHVYADGKLIDKIQIKMNSLDNLDPADTQATDKKPNGWSVPSIKDLQISDNMKWSVWESQYIPNYEWVSIMEKVSVGSKTVYKNGEYSIEEVFEEVDEGYWKGKWSFYSKNGSPLKKYYLVSLSTDTTLMHDPDNKTSNGEYMKSGYGVNIEVKNTITGNGEHTNAQTGVVCFPEFEYKEYYRKLDGNSLMRFKENKYDLNNGRTHYTPLWYPDNQKYEVRARVLDVWTPAGMLNTTTSDYKMIKGNLYDDWSPTYGK